MRAHLGKLFPLLGALSLIGACATEPDPLDRTQPEAIPKSIFEGTWYYNMTTTDAEYQNSYTFIGEQTQTYMDKAFNVKWEITKDRLNAHMMPQVYLDDSGNPVENPYGQKSIVLSFAITKHYDIRYRYNSTTREELNVIEENTDRPWQQREYMEVDWSQNLATNMWNPTQMDVSLSNIERENVASYENVDFWARSPDGDKDNDILINTRKWRKDVDPEVYLINIDVKESIASKLRWWWQIYYGGYMDPTTVRFRHSLMKIPTGDKATYKPMQYDDQYFRRFGFFRTEYNVRDPKRWDSLESQKKYLINRWDLSGNKVLTWYLSPSSQELINNGDTLLLDVAKEVVATWNGTLKEAAGRTDDVVTLKENVVLKDADGNDVTRSDGTKRWKYELGDLRYPMINFVSKQGEAQPLGYGPSVPDASTGEIIHANTNVYYPWCEWVIQRALDQYDVAAGHCTLDDVKNGRYFDPVKNKCTAGDPNPPENGPSNPAAVGITTTGGPGSITAGTQKPTGLAALRYMSPTLQAAYWPKADPAKPLPKELIQEIASGQSRPRFKQMFDASLRQNTVIDLNGFKTLAGSKFETSMLPQSTLLSNAPYGEGIGDPLVMSLLSPASRLNAESLASYKNRMINELMLRDEPVMFEPAIHAFVEEMKNKPRAEVEKTVRHWIYYTATLHEMGHTIGLRHNFKASADERNFPAEYTKAKKEYWDKIDALRAQYKTKIDAGDAEAYAAYIRAVDDIPSIKDRYGSSSIMDYHGDWMDWHIPVRSYDRAALLFGYGKKVEVKENGKWVVKPYVENDFVQNDYLNETEKAKSGRIVRYYLMGSDEKTFDDAFTTMFDRGTTATEIIRNFIKDAQVGYFFQNFKRNRTSFEGAKNGYYWRKWLRVYYMMAKPLAQLQINSMWYPEFWGSIWDGLDPIVKGPESRDMKPGYYRDGGEDLLRASMLVYNYFLYDILMRPNYGYYSRKLDTSGKRFWEFTDPRYLNTEDDLNVFIDIGAGWGFNDRWDVQADPRQYYEKMQRIGVETDKTIAYEVLSIPAALNNPLYYEKANGLSFWNTLWTNNGWQLWDVTRGLISDNHSHTDNPWCMKCDAACRANPKTNPPVLKAYPVHYLEGLARAGVFTNPAALLPSGKNRCGKDEEPLEPGMDALFAIKPMFYAISGASHPWYQNGLAEKLDSQVKGGLHRFDIPPEAVAEGKVVEFTNPFGTKTYQAVQSSDNVSISYQIVDNARRIKNRVDLYEACSKSVTYSGPLLNSIGTNNHNCSEVLSCFASNPKMVPDWCAEEGWDSSFSLEMTKYQAVERAEAMLIMMQDMIDLTGHYAWRIPGYLEGD